MSSLRVVPSTPSIGFVELCHSLSPVIRRYSCSCQAAF